MDFSEAFDKVPRKELLLKLSDYGIDQHTLGRISSITLRLQCVILDGEKSGSINLTSGVPHGSVLGPILFLAFIKDPPNCILSKVGLLADDTVIYLVVKSLDDCVQLQNHLHNLEKWEKNWKMEFNIAKCNVLSPSFSVTTLRGRCLEAIDSTKCLGVFPSKDLRIL